MSYTRFFFILSLLILSCFFAYNIFYPLYISNEVIITYGINPFNICEEQPVLWDVFKNLFLFTYIFSNIIIFNFIYSKFKNFFPKKKSSKAILNNCNSLQLLIGKDLNKNNIYISEKSLYQNVLITGTIGTGKTSSAMYPFTKQLMEYKHSSKLEKLGMLILDVKGNYYAKVKEYCKIFNRDNDLIVIDLSGKIKYNPLHKPNLKASVLADRLKTILLLFSPNNSESFWLDKAEQILTECIKLCRLYNDNYVTFDELHKLIVFPNYYLEKISILKNKFLQNNLSKEDCYNLLSALNFFEKEYKVLDERTISILKSEITRITNLFVSDYKIKNVFCPKKDDLNFLGFADVINKGKIVVLNMNIAEYKNLSKLIAAYLKLDFQTEVMNRLNKINYSKRPVAFISDEFHEYVTSSDSAFFAQSREAKCINIVATQSYTSLLNTLNNQSTVKVITQNLVNKLWFRTDDIFTIEDAQKQIGKEEKEKISQTFTEGSKETNFNYLFNKLNSKNSNISESFNSYFQTDYIFDTNFFTQNLEVFSCLSFLSDGEKILKPQKIKMLPYFKN